MQEKAKRIKVSIEVEQFETSYTYHPILKLEEKIEGDYQLERLREYGLSLIRDLRLKFSKEIGEFIDKEYDKMEIAAGKE